MTNPQAPSEAGISPEQAGTNFGVAYLRAALREIAKARGAYSRDPLTHAGNTIESMAEIAKAALAHTWEIPDAD